MRRRASARRRGWRCRPSSVGKVGKRARLASMPGCASMPPPPGGSNAPIRGSAWRGGATVTPRLGSRSRTTPGLSRGCSPSARASSWSNPRRSAARCWPGWRRSVTGSPRNQSRNQSWGQGVAESLEERFRRLLTMVPYIVKHPGVSVRDIRSRFRITPSQLVADLNLLFVCGLPGYGPGDLIEAFVDGSRVWIRLADYFARPLRLTAAEGLLLYSGARALASSGAGDDALDRAIKALE